MDFGGIWKEIVELIKEKNKKLNSRKVAEGGSNGERRHLTPTRGKGIGIFSIQTT